MTRSKKVLTDTGLNKLVTNINNTFAPLNSPALTGAPTAPTPTSGDNSTKIATTAFVQATASEKVNLTSTISDVDIGALWEGVDPEELAINDYAPLNSPAFTGVPTAPTPDASDSSTKLATTAFVKAVVNNSSSGAPAVHTHAANDIVTLTGYVKASEANALSTADTLNQALGKLEKALDGKQPAGNYATMANIPTIASLYVMGDNTNTITVTDDDYPDLTPKITQMFTMNVSNSSSYLAYNQPEITVGNYTWHNNAANVNVTLTFADNSTLSKQYHFIHKFGIGCTGVVDTGLTMNVNYKFEVIGELIVDNGSSVFVGAYSSNDCRTTCRFLPSKFQHMWASNIEYQYPGSFIRTGKIFTLTQTKNSITITQGDVSVTNSPAPPTFTADSSKIYLFGETTSSNYNSVIIYEVKISEYNEESGEYTLLRDFTPESDGENIYLRDLVTDQIYTPVNGATYLSEADASSMYGLV